MWNRAHQALVQVSRPSIDDRLWNADAPPLPRMAWVEVQLDALVFNVATLRTIAGDGCTFAAVIKADGYGHGIEATALAARAAGAGYLSVATLDEALLLRACGDSAPILVNYPVPANALGDAAQAGIEVTVGSDEDLEAIVALRADAPGVHVEIDSGMMRGGFSPTVATAAARRLADRRVRVQGVWSHLAAPEDRDRTLAQIRTFESTGGTPARRGCRPKVAPPMCVWRPALLRPCVRHGPGGSCAVRRAPLSASIRDQLGQSSDWPALSVKARAVRIADVETGDSVGYSGAWVAPRPSRIATLPIGYADGWLRGAGPRTHVLVRGSRAPVVGRISSDSMSVDVTDVPAVDERDVFVLLGEDQGERISAEEVASTRDTISWEVLQTLSRRLPRLYLIDDVNVALRRLDDRATDHAARLPRTARACQCRCPGRGVRVRVSADCVWSAASRDIVTSATRSSPPTVRGTLAEMRRIARAVRPDRLQTSPGKDYLTAPAVIPRTR